MVNYPSRQQFDIHDGVDHDDSHDDSLDDVDSSHSLHNHTYLVHSHNMSHQYHHSKDCQNRKH